MVSVEETMKKKKLCDAKLFSCAYFDLCMFLAKKKKSNLFWLYHTHCKLHSNVQAKIILAN